ncbi:hypothetical protein PFFCH_01400 [Plasmodium falciparum FCH/4]|uniref:Uncharacterized protein n=1 Tax=Plasmodium falciparum FCH/4 TaxID=1036724 RepID=A0A024VRP6_PLAFA|nr:hypothetical protein PFFCH_01400 [Plasmodium falciparum FCH/4]
MEFFFFFFQRLDIIKDLYDMLQNELTIQHGYKLEWIVIYLICIEVLIDIVWTIIIKGVFKWVLIYHIKN